MIEINNLTGKSVPASFLKRVAGNVLLLEKQKGAELSVVIAGEAFVRTLNRRYRGKDKVANVLSFPIAEFGLGEIVLCPAEIRKDAKKYGISYTKALAWMLIHGMLHLMGYTHSQMEKREQAYRSKI